MPLYNWNLLPEEQLNPLISRKAIHMKGLTIARLHLAKGAVVPEHRHVHEQVATVERGALKFFIEGRELVLKSGESLAIASDIPHRVEAIEDTVVVDVFSPSREDWQSGNDSYLRK
ncbi:MAG TPA: cupin domain-containing protein [Candidatus Limnocylindrales bacterium]|nr:cupin domain-containing protein [Candidatus Limnocylindrales bacterium]